QRDIGAGLYNNYRRRSSGFSSTTSHGGPSDDESDEYIPPRKDSSTSNASSGYESGLAPCHQSPPVSSSIRTESGSSVASEASTSSCYYNNNNNNNNNNNGSSNSTKYANKRLTKMNSSDKDIDIDDRQQLSLNTVSGYVDDLMERILKMPPKKRAKFYQMLDEERLKDLNNNNQDNPRKSKIIEGEDDENEHRMAMDVSMPLVVAEAHSDEEDDRTLIELKPNAKSVHLNDDDNEEVKETLKQQQPFFGLNEKSYEELLSMGVPLAVLRVVDYQKRQQTQSLNANNNQVSNFLTNKRSATSSTNISSDKNNILNASKILQRILQEHQKEQQGETLIESMNY
ncbi:unnamed protein product, partial [Rotaria socialis]